MPLTSRDGLTRKNTALGRKSKWVSSCIGQNSWPEWKLSLNRMKILSVTENPDGTFQKHSSFHPPPAVKKPEITGQVSIFVPVVAGLVCRLDCRGHFTATGMLEGCPRGHGLLVGHGVQLGNRGQSERHHNKK